jgi:Protein of unknown function (DUF4197)
VRRLSFAAAALVALLVGSFAYAKNPLSGLKGGPSESDAASGIKEAMAQGVQGAITQLGRQDGFLNDQLVRIALPGNLRKIADAARQVGAGKYVDELEVSMNRAAEKAIPAAADVFADAVRQMTVTDALEIVRGSDDAGTQYFRRVTQDRLREKFMPIVSSATEQTGVAKKFKALNDKGGGLGKLMGGGKSNQSTDLNSYVTDKAMDGLFYYVAQKEKEIRSNPLKQGSDLLSRVFGH